MTAPSSTKKPRGSILVVDDSAGDRKLISLALEAEGYAIVQASGGEEGLKLLQDPAISVDLVLCDILMPGMDGVEFVGNMLEILPNMKVLFISGQKRPFAFDLGGKKFDFVEKTSDMSHLIEKVSQVLDPRSSIAKWIDKVRGA